jgi:hypothetical protein
MTALCTFKFLDVCASDVGYGSSGGKAVVSKLVSFIKIVVFSKITYFPIPPPPRRQFYYFLFFIPKFLVIIIFNYKRFY